MPGKYQSKASRAKRLQQNVGVKHGTVRSGRGGRGLRRYDASTGRWNLVSMTGRTKGAMGAKSSQVKSRSAGSGSSAADFVVRNVSPASSSGSAWTSTGGAGSSKRRVTRRTNGFSFGTPPNEKRTAKTIVSRRTGR